MSQGKRILSPKKLPSHSTVYTSLERDVKTFAYHDKIKQNNINKVKYSDKSLHILSNMSDVEIWNNLFMSKEISSNL